MQVYEPYHIHHVDLDQHKPLTVPESNCFEVYWSGATPLAHLWIEKNNLPASETSYRQRIETAIQPAKEYYHQHPFSINQNASIQKLSVIICSGNGIRNLEKCIHALLNNADTDFELIVIDNAPKNSCTKDLVQKLKQVKYIPELRKGLNIARNTGARAANHPLIAYTTDDIAVSRDWIRNIKNAFYEPEVMATTGVVFPRSLETIAQYTFEKYWGFNSGYLPRTFNRSYLHKQLADAVPVWDIGVSENMAFRKEIFDWVGGFDERLDDGTSGCIGYAEIWYRILANGWTCSYIPANYVFHSHGETQTALSRQLGSLMRGQSGALLLQFEKFHEQGNLRRLYKLIPKYYCQRFLNRYIKKEESRGFLYSEIKGLFAGWFNYYLRTKNPGYILPFFMPYKLHHPAIVNPDVLVSVIIPCNNSSAYLEEAIKSVLNQTHQPVEVIIVDESSGEEIESVCCRFGGQIRYVRIDESGVSIARNSGVRYSQGYFLVFLDPEDYLYPDALAKNMGWFRQYPDAVFISGGHDQVDAAGNYLANEKQEEKKSDAYLSLLQGNYISIESTVMYRRSVFPAFHFDPLLATCGDYDLNLRISRYFKVYSHTEKITVNRIHRRNEAIDRKMIQHYARTVLNRQKAALLTDSEQIAWKEGIRKLEQKRPHSAKWRGVDMNQS